MKYLKPLRFHNEILKSNVTANWRLLGVDVGDKYLGIAVSSENNTIASPLCVLVRSKKNIDLIARDLNRLKSSLSLGGFVFGYPRQRDGNSVDAGHVQMFADQLRKTGKLADTKYTLWEECFTSKSIEFLLKPLDLPGVQCKTITDKFAAVQILQGYLDFMNKIKLQSEFVPLQEDGSATPDKYL